MSREGPTKNLVRDFSKSVSGFGKS